VREILKNKDILFGNLETVLSNRGKKAEKAVVLCSPPEKVSYLEDAGFDVLNTANNHIMDSGVEGFHDTLEVLRKVGLAFVGANDEPAKDHVILKKQGIRLGFLGYMEGGFELPENNVWINRLEPADIMRDIELIKEQCDFVIVSLHWGIENVFYPSSKQIELAHRLIDYGATVLLGHHPHVIQGIEEYKDGLIAYSLGNFQFEFNPKECIGKREKRTNQSIILSLEIEKNGLKDYDTIPVKIDRDFVPYIMNERERKEILDFVLKISNLIVRKQVNEKKWFEEISEEYLCNNMKSWIVRIKRYGIKHLLQCIRWLLSPFVIRCYIGFLAKRLRRR